MRRSRIDPLLAPSLALPLMLAARAASAQGTPPTIAACYVPASGTIYRIDTDASPAPGAPAQCLSPLHRRFGWSAQPGPSDVNPVTVAGTPPVLDNRGLRSMRAECPAGKRRDQAAERVLRHHGGPARLRQHALLPRAGVLRQGAVGAPGVRKAAARAHTCTSR
jgi:hypothetical protein